MDEFEENKSLDAYDANGKKMGNGNAKRKYNWSKDMAKYMFTIGAPGEDTMTPEQAAVGIAEMDKICYPDPDRAPDTQEELVARAESIAKMFGSTGTVEIQELVTRVAWDCYFKTKYDRMTPIAIWKAMKRSWKRKHGAGQQ